MWMVSSGIVSVVCLKIFSGRIKFRFELMILGFMLLVVCGVLCVCTVQSAPISSTSNLAFSIEGP